MNDRRVPMLSRNGLFTAIANLFMPSRPAACAISRANGNAWRRLLPR